MANTEYVSGIHTYCLYGEETTYGTAVAATTQFGIQTSFKPSVENNISLRRGFAGSGTTAREAVNSVVGTMDVSSSVEFDVQNWTFMKYVLGSASGTSTVTYTPADNPPSITITSNLDNPGTSPTDREESYPGSVIETCNIRTAVGEPVTASLDIMSKTITYDATISTKVAVGTQDVYTFAGADVECPDSSSLTNIIDSVEITIKATWNMLKGLGSRLTQRAVARQLEYSLNFTVKTIDDALLLKALGAATPTATGGPTVTSITAKFVSGTRSCELRFTNVQINWNEDMTMNEVLTEGIPAVARNCVAVEIV